MSDIVSITRKGSVRGRGAAENPPNRFERFHVEPDPETEEDPGPRTQFFRDASRSIIATNDSPDVPFDASVNPYRGCEVGCAYCYARPTHEYFGLSPGLDFESKIFVKEDAPELLGRELSSPRWTPKVVSMSGVTDPYQPVERRLGLTRRCLEVFVEFRNPVGIITKNALVARDADLLSDLARFDAAAVFVSITSLDKDLARVLEPRASQPRLRLSAIEALAQAGVPVGVMVAPVIPGLTDHELPSIVEAAGNAGARFASYSPVRLPHAVGSLFEQWLDTHVPGRKEKVLNRIRAIRGGRLNNTRFGERMHGQGPFAAQIDALFKLGCKKASIASRGPQLSTAAFRRPAPGGLMSLFA